ncbi:hypothetical protein GF402_12020 [Candidatus Fermentibacteria bacterium]|nr:hypothetical protein [Candidatus Fermentibacteria bacterium]
MMQKVLVRVLIVVLAALLIFRIHQKVESYRIPRENCREQILTLAKTNINYMKQNDGLPAPSLDSLISWADLQDSILICPTLMEQGYTDSQYIYDPKLALGTQFAISCPNHERHGGVIGGLIEEDFPDTLFYEADWMNTYFRTHFPEYAQRRRVEVSRSALVRVSEEQATYLGNRYPQVLKPKEPENLDVNTEELVDPLGGEYVFEVRPDTLYTFYENPDAPSWRRGGSVNVQTYKFVAYTTSNPDTSRVEIFYKHPLTLPSRPDGSSAGSNDRLVIIRYWDYSEFGSLRKEEREVDLLDVPRWQFLQNYAEQHSELQETD